MAMPSAIRITGQSRIVRLSSSASPKNVTWGRSGRDALPRSTISGGATRNDCCRVSSCSPCASGAAVGSGVGSGISVGCGTGVGCGTRVGIGVGSWVGRYRRRLLGRLRYRRRLLGRLRYRRRLRRGCRLRRCCRLLLWRRYGHGHRHRHRDCRLGALPVGVVDGGGFHVLYLLHRVAAHAVGTRSGNAADGDDCIAVAIGRQSERHAGPSTVRFGEHENGVVANVILVNHDLDGDGRVKNVVALYRIPLGVEDLNGNAGLQFVRRGVIQGVPIAVVRDS